MAENDQLKTPERLVNKSSGKGSIASRLFLTSLLVLVLSLSVAGWVISVTFENSIRSDMDERLRVMLDMMIGVSERDADGLLRFSRPVLDQRFDEPLSGFYWQISAEDEDAFRSRSLWDQELSTDLDERSLSGRYGAQLGPEGQQLRVLEQDIILPQSSDIYRYMVALDTGAIDAAIYHFDRTLKWAMGLIALTILLSVTVQSIFVLNPLRAIGRRLKEVRTGRRNQIEGDFPREIAPLAAEINGLIDHNNTVLSRARTHVGNLAHALKTPLSIIQNAAEEATDPAHGDQLREQAQIMQAHIDHHLKRARVSGRMFGAGVPVALKIDKIVSAMQVIFRDEDKHFHLACDTDIIFAGEEEDLTEVIGNLLENACKYGGNQIYITLKAADVMQTQSKSQDRRFFKLVVEDNGAGVSAADMDTILQRGVRLDQQIKGSGLGLSIINDVVDLYGGDVTPSRSDYGGLAITLLLPAVS